MQLIPSATSRSALSASHARSCPAAICYHARSTIAVTGARPAAGHALIAGPTLLGAPTLRKRTAVSAQASPSGASTSRQDLLRAEIKAMEAERDTATSTAESCAKTATKLAEMARLLEQLALEKVRVEDATGAKQALQEKASVVEALDKNSSKADANYKLASVLNQRIAEKQNQLLAAVRGTSTSTTSSTTSSSTSSTPYSSAPASPTSYPSYSSSTVSSADALKWKWQKSLEDAKERLKAQEEEAAKEGRMARLSAEASITAAKERIASRAAASVREAQERIRMAAAESQGTIAAAQARLRSRDEEVLEYVRRVMSRYRRGEYVSEDELEFAFQQLEKRFIL